MQIEKTSNKLKRTDWQYLILSLCVSAGLLWYIFTRIDLSDLGNLYKNIYLRGFFIYLILYGLLIVLRSIRFHLLVGSDKITLQDMVLVTMIRNLFVDLLPARLGSLSYIYVLTRRFGFAFEIGASSLLISILFDFLIIVPLLIIAIFAVGTGNNIFYDPVFLSGAAGFLFIFIVLIIFLVPILRIGFFITNWIILKLHLENVSSVKFLMNKFWLTIEQTIAIKKRGVLYKVFFVTVLVRLCKYASLYYLLYGLLYSEGIRLYALDFWKIFLCSAGGELSAMLPIHGFAGFGTWAAAWSFVFTLMGFEEKLAILSGVGIHLVTQVVEYTIGLIAIFLLLRKRK